MTEWLSYFIGPGQVGSIPFKFGINAIRLGAAGFGFLALVHMIELGKINIGHQLCFHVIYSVCQCIHELVKIFFVEENLVLFVRESIFLEPLFTFGDRQIIIIRTGRLHIKEVRPLAGGHPFRKYLTPVIVVF